MYLKQLTDIHDSVGGGADDPARDADLTKRRSSKHFLCIGYHPVNHKVPTFSTGFT